MKVVLDSSATMSMALRSDLEVSYNTTDDHNSKTVQYVEQIRILQTCEVAVAVVTHNTVELEVVIWLLVSLFHPLAAYVGVSCNHYYKQLNTLYVSAQYNLKNGVFWDVTPCGSCKNRRFGGT
jgi:hypothetical protein